MRLIRSSRGFANGRKEVGNETALAEKLASKIVLRIKFIPGRAFRKRSNQLLHAGIDSLLDDHTPPFGEKG